MFNEIFKKLRIKNKKTQQEMADFLGVDRTTIGKYETTKTVPPAEVLKRLAEFFNVSVDYLIGVSSVRNPSDTEDDEDEVIIIRRESKKMTSNQRKKMMNVLMAAFDDFDWED